MGGETVVGCLLPKYFYVPEPYVDLERAKRGQATRLPSRVGSAEGNVFLWGQSVWIIAQLLRQWRTLLPSCLRSFSASSSRPPSSSSASGARDSSTHARRLPVARVPRRQA